MPNILTSITSKSTEIRPARNILQKTALGSTALILFAAAAGFSLYFYVRRRNQTNRIAPNSQEDPESELGDDSLLLVSDNNLEERDMLQETLIPPLPRQQEALQNTQQHSAILEETS